MTLICCPECERQISDKALACPGCGAPVPPVVLSTQQNSTPVRTVMSEAEIRKAVKARIRITEQIITIRPEAELRKAIGEQFKIVEQRFDTESLSHKVAPAGKVEVSLSKIEKGWLISVDLDDDSKSNTPLGWILLVLLILTLWIYVSGWVALGLIMVCLALQANKSKLTAQQIARCLKNLKNEFNTTV